MSGHDHGREPLPPSWFETNVQTIVRAVVAICVLLLVGDVVFHFVGHKHIHFAVEGWVGFYAVVGFISYVGLVLTAKQLRKLVMRRLDFYGEEVAASALEQSLSQRRRDAEVAEERQEAESESDAESDSESKSESESDSESESESESDSESDSESESESESDEEEDGDEEDAR